MEPTTIQVNGVTDATRTILYNELCDAMVEGIKAHILEYESAQDSAKYILQLESITSYSQLMAFLETLSEKWPAYKAVFMLVKEVETKVADETVINKVLSEIKQFE